MRTVADRLRSIAAASEQQSSGLQQVSHSVGSLDEITRQNAAMVEHSASASLDLVARARRLTEAVGSIRLRQGSADEARAMVERAMVERAMQRIREIGLPAAAAEFRRSDTGFVDRDLYVFVIDRAGCYRVHGAKPAMEGQRVHQVPGIDGDRFMRDAWAAADDGSGWIDYQIVNPVNSQVQPKASFIVRLDADQVIGCGCYRHADPPAPASPAPSAIAPRGRVRSAGAMRS